MSDFYFSKLYRDVKGDDWIEQDNLSDFLSSAPRDVIDECFAHHNFEQHLTDLGNVEHFRRHHRHLSLAYKKNNLVFVPVLKCASTFFCDLFTNRFQGWSTVNLYELDWTGIKAFGILMDPYQRRLNGIMQILCNIYGLAKLESLLDHDQDFANVVAMIPWLDAHSMPYCVMFGDLLHRIHWIPMEIGRQQWISQLNGILTEDRIDPSYPALNKTNPAAVQVREKLKRAMLSPPHNEFIGAIAFAEDSKFYSALMSRYTSFFDH